MLKRRTRIKRQLRLLLKRARGSKAAWLGGLILLVAIAFWFRQAPMPASPPPVATDRMCQIIWESVGFFNRVGIQEMRDSQFETYNRFCR